MLNYTWLYINNREAYMDHIAIVWLYISLWWP